MVSYVQTVLLLGAAILQSCSADIHFTTIPSPLRANERNALHYSGGNNSEPATILLLKGLKPPSPLYIETVTSQAMGGVFAWTPSLGLVNGDDYWLYINQEGFSETGVGCSLVGATTPVASSSASSMATSTKDLKGTASANTKTPEPASDRSNSQQPTKQGLSTDVLIGIGVGCGALVIALVVALVFVYHRLHNLRAERRSSLVISRPFYNSSSVQIVDQPMERAMWSMYEKEGQARSWELGTNANRYEVGGKARGARFELGS